MITRFLVKKMAGFSVRELHTSPAIHSSAFIKRQKIVDPEMVKLREERMRKKIEKEIKKLKEHSKKYKPVQEMKLPVHIAKNLSERIREPANVMEEVEDERRAIWKDYNRLILLKANLDNVWMRKALTTQRNALLALRRFSPELFEAALQPDTSLLPIVHRGPCLTPPIKDYELESPDGEYIDTTRTYAA